MRRGESLGFSYEIDETRLDDIRLVECIATITDESAPQFSRLTSATQLLTILLGKEQKDRLYAHIGKEYEGRVPVEKVTEFFTDILTAENDSKN